MTKDYRTVVVQHYVEDTHYEFLISFMQKLQLQFNTIIILRLPKQPKQTACTKYIFTSTRNVVKKITNCYVSPHIKQIINEKYFSIPTFVHFPILLRQFHS